MIGLGITLCPSCETSVYDHDELGPVEYFTGDLHDCPIDTRLDVEPWEDIDL